jgi:hypothetical protein
MGKEKLINMGEKGEMGRDGGWNEKRENGNL